MTVEDVRADLAAAENQKRAECPVTVVGMGPRRLIYLVSPGGAFHALSSDRMTQNALIGVFEGDLAWCAKTFPPSRDRDAGDIAKIRWSNVVEFLVRWAAERGQVNADTLLRGPGYWPGDNLDGAAPLVVHCGDRVLFDGRWRRPGLIAGRVYVSSYGFPRPAERAGVPTGDDEPEYLGAPMTAEQGKAMLAFFGRWNWRDAESARLLCGWIAAAFLPGVLSWRPHLWISGDRATGKSTLQRVVADVLGDSLLSLADSTEAGVRQQLAGGARPVAIDEIEPDDQNDRAAAVVRLARLASQRGGGRVARGGSDGAGTVTSIDAVFLFSSILRPPLSPQDMQRITVLDLEPLAADAEARAALLTEARKIARLGPALQARLIAEWPRFEVALGMYQAALVRAGHGTRAADQIGALLALADLLLNDHPLDNDSADERATKFNPMDMAERIDDAPDHERCLEHILTSYPAVRAFGGQKSIASHLSAYFTPQGSEADLSDLRQSGLSVYERDGEVFLAVANRHQGVATLFKDTHWRATSGATGAWVQALRRLPGAKGSGDPVRFAGIRSRATLIPVACLPLDSVARAGDSAADSAAQGPDYVGF